MLPPSQQKKTGRSGSDIDGQDSFSGTGQPHELLLGFPSLGRTSTNVNDQRVSPTEAETCVHSKTIEAREIVCLGYLSGEITFTVGGLGRVVWSRHENDGGSTEWVI